MDNVAHWKHGSWIALISAVVLAFGLFLLIPLTQLLEDEEPIPMTVRQVLTLNPPTREAPPPPEDAQPEEEVPPPKFEQVVQDIPLMELDLELDPGASDAIAMATPLQDFADETEVMESIEQIFSFDDMAESPRLVSVPRVRFPRTLSARGVLEGRVVLLVVIDEEGLVSVERVVSSTHEELVEEALRVAKKARFSIPVVDGKKVKVRGEWPLLMQALEK
ncbi:energy transducer TonB [Pelagicoccus albus]|uniref:TonB family protein n=1 Tax=Pelagicoccus albus TaxID=415222 RepID=A0A7X1E9P7_9BACT|nr:TonB family protein [Pelagicoccus albus]MBC2607566.1 TonB family protein [Pelagicoccus albus]